MITISKSAQNHFSNILKRKKDKCIKISVLYPNTNYTECSILYCKKKDKKDNIKEIKFSKFSVYIDEKSFKFLKKAKIDFINTEIESKLVLKVPKKNTKNKYSKKEIFNEIKKFFKKYIDKKLSIHNGKIKLVKITENMKLLVQFHGSCNGCSMSNLTLREGIEKSVIKRFPEIKGIIDVTKHKKTRKNYFTSFDF
ncbi:NifU family protein [bacterium endosymbiont of Pedicinus badii]|uniref:NifU family protein n=1 Tax=bacterium endosymbiont of Pedicinus badii TaxID=1719126 RepID=UPI0009B9A414|nr:NifU family protein [bacterium endosymbiont of Pedicinus badii]OQM34091.1 hypothetical protein AOQ89_01965 [bacterium endosymbiont of Pedicinus badii]